MPGICFYHSADLDGLCSAHIVAMKYPHYQMYGINYSDPFPWDLITAETDVYMVDFSLQPFSDMEKLAGMAKSLTWIDHHKTAIENLYADPKERVTYLDKFDNGLTAYLRIGIGACELCWEYLHPDEPVPYGIHLLASYDVWDHSDPNTLPFQYYARIHAQLPPGDVGLDFLTEDIAQYDRSVIGESIMLYEAQLNAKIAKSYTYETELDGLRILAWNRHPSNSLNFKAVWDPEKHDVMCAYGYCRDKWVVSLYTDKPEVDVSSIAKRYGGGGHKGAAGFHTDERPYWLD